MHITTVSPLSSESNGVNVNVEYIEDRDQVQNCLEMELKSGDILLTLGAGDVWKEGEEFIQARKAKDIV